MASKLGERVMNVRIETGLSRAALARRASTDPAYLLRIEQGKVENPPINTVVRLAEALGISLDDLLRGTIGPRNVRKINAARRAQLLNEVKRNLAEATRLLDELLSS